MLQNACKTRERLYVCTFELKSTLMTASCCQKNRRWKKSFQFFCVLRWWKISGESFVLECSLTSKCSQQKSKKASHTFFVHFRSTKGIASDRRPIPLLWNPLFADLSPLDTTTLFLLLFLFLLFREFADWEGWKVGGSPATPSEVRILPPHLLTVCVVCSKIIIEKESVSSLTNPENIKLRKTFTCSQIVY